MRPHQSFVESKALTKVTETKRQVSSKRVRRGPESQQDRAGVHCDAASPPRVPSKDQALSHCGAAAGNPHGHSKNAEYALGRQRLAARGPSGTLTAGTASATAVPFVETTPTVISGDNGTSTNVQHSQQEERCRTTAARPAEHFPKPGRGALRLHRHAGRGLRSPPASSEEADVKLSTVGRESRAPTSCLSHDARLRLGAICGDICNTPSASPGYALFRIPGDGHY